MLWNPSHPHKNIAYDSFLKIWSSIAIHLSEFFKLCPPMAARQFLHSVQLRLGIYFQSIDTMNTAEARLIPPPNLVELLVSVRVQSWVPQIMPQVPTALPSAPVAPLAAPPAPVAAGPQPCPQDASCECVANPAVNPEIIAAMEGRHFQIRELFSDTVRP